MYWPNVVGFDLGGFGADGPADLDAGDELKPAIRSCGQSERFKSVRFLTLPASR